jgi:electron transfer flavoprotein alpha subunit
VGEFGSAESVNTPIEPISDQFSAAMSASRAAVDAGCAPND